MEKKIKIANYALRYGQRVNADVVAGSVREVSGRCLGGVWEVNSTARVESMGAYREGVHVYTAQTRAEGSFHTHARVVYVKRTHFVVDFPFI